MTTQTLTTRGPKTAQAIANREPFFTHGSLQGEITPDGAFTCGRLTGEDYATFHRDARSIRYIVYSYATPIAWYTPNGWYKVAQKFSVTTTKHQGNLYLI